MIAETQHFRVVVIGSGPAGHKAAIQAAKGGVTVLVVEAEAEVGGACVKRGTIPSKTLRETAVLYQAFRQRSGIDFNLPNDLRLEGLFARLEQVVTAHQRYYREQLDRNGVQTWTGRARFESSTRLEVLSVGGQRRIATADIVIIAVGSKPRSPPDVPVDHQHVLDSDSILAINYLPRSLTILGAGVIASEYASIFSSLGVEVTMIDKGPRPLAFIDPELTSRFLDALHRRGGRFIGNSRHKSVEHDGISEVVTILEDGTRVASEKLLCCLGRVANLDRMDVERAGLQANARGLLEVDADGRTAVPNIYAAGDVIGPPSLASASMEQGRTAARAALGLPRGAGFELVPAGIYTIPEIGAVGLDEAQAIAKHGRAIVGRAEFAELARGQISAIPDGLLKMVADPRGQRILGVQVVGEGATELVHLGQVAILAEWTVDHFIDNIFNFPTLAEAYRVAALDIVKRR